MLEYQRISMHEIQKYDENTYVFQILMDTKSTKIDYLSKITLDTVFEQNFFITS